MKVKSDLIIFIYRHFANYHLPLSDKELIKSIGLFTYNRIGHLFNKVDVFRAFETTYEDILLAGYYPNTDIEINDKDLDLLLFVYYNTNTNNKSLQDIENDFMIKKLLE